MHGAGRVKFGEVFGTMWYFFKKINLRSISFKKYLR